MWCCVCFGLIPLFGKPPILMILDVRFLYKSPFLPASRWIWSLIHIPPQEIVGNMFWNFEIVLRSAYITTWYHSKDPFQISISVHFQNCTWTSWWVIGTFKNRCKTWKRGWRGLGSYFHTISLYSEIALAFKHFLL